MGDVDHPAVPPAAAPHHPLAPGRRPPQIVAHRGASTEAPEHTYAAYVAAIGADADALECDVRLTADGHLVCVHDRRVDRTSNGTGRVSSLELARLQELDFGSWYESQEEAKEGEEPDREARGVLTLRTLLDLVAAQSRPVELAIEVKHPTRYAGKVERSLVALLDEYGWVSRRHGQPSPVRVMSFSSSAVRRVRRLAPGLRTVFLMEPLVYRARGGVLPSGVPIAGPSIEILRTRPEAVRRWQRSGHPVHVWTVDEPEDFELCLSLGVDAVITNRPRAMREALSAHVSSPAD